MSIALDQVNELRRELGFVTCEERFHTVLGADGKPVEVAITVARTRTGLAFYRDGTGPFYQSRAARRSHHRGVEGHHDGSKQPTKGRVLRGKGGGTPWKGAELR